MKGGLGLRARVEGHKGPGLGPWDFSSTQRLSQRTGQRGCMSRISYWWLNQIRLYSVY